MATRFNVPEQRMLSYPIPVFWQGWESTTLKLQQTGWKLAVQLDPYQHDYKLLMQHPEMKLVGISHNTRLDFDSITGHYRTPDMTPDFFEVQHIARSIDINIMSHNMIDPVRINAEPAMMEHTVRKLSDLNCFRTDDTRVADEVLVEQADMSVIEHLEAIKALQSDKQKELREKARKASAVESAPTSSVIVQLVNYR